jgi:hypothetical protein
MATGQMLQSLLRRRDIGADRQTNLEEILPLLDAPNGQGRGRVDILLKKQRHRGAWMREFRVFHGDGPTEPASVGKTGSNRRPSSR